MRTAKRAAAILLLVLAATATGIQAQPKKWPQRPVRLIVPIAPGGSVDIIARMAATRLTDRLGQQFIVDNRPGAGSTIGVAIAARASPDGYTIIMLSPAFAASTSLYKLTYDPIKDIAPIGMLAAGPMFLVVHPSVKAGTLKEFIALARSSPATLTYGSGGIGSTTHLAVELLGQMTRTELAHVPYKGIGSAMSDLLSGQIRFYVAPGAAILSHAAAGRLRLLAVTGEQRSPEMPELPAISEVVPGYSATFWYGLAAPAGTPKAVIVLLNQEVAHFVQQPDVQKRLRTYDLEPAHTSPQAFARAIEREIALWARVVKAGNIKLE